jgi:hypothetical protein
LIIVANFVKFGIGMCTMGTSKPRLEKESYIWKTQPTFGFVSKQGIVEIF